MAALALRFIACTGVLVGALIMGDSGSGLAGADPGGASQAGGDEQFSKGVNNEGVAAETTIADVTGEPKAQSASSAASPRRPQSRFGSGRECGSPCASDQNAENAASGREGTLKKGSNGVVLDPVPFLEGVALRVPAPYLPTPPQPTPSPSFRGQEEEEPVPAAASGGGGTEATAFGGVADLPVLEAPVVVAPRVSGVPAVVSPVPPATVPIPPATATSGASTPRMAGAEPAASGSSSPAVRMRDAQPESPPAGTAAPLGTQPQRLGYAQYLRTAGLPGLFGAALPGLAGILLFTLGGTAIGYRQARTGRLVRMTPAARLLP